MAAPFILVANQPVDPLLQMVTSLNTDREIFSDYLFPRKLTSLLNHTDEPNGLGYETYNWTRLTDLHR